MTPFLLVFCYRCKFLKVSFSKCICLFYFVFFLVDFFQAFCLLDKDIVQCRLSFSELWSLAWASNSILLLVHGEFYFYFPLIGDKVSSYISQSVLVVSYFFFLGASIILYTPLLGHFALISSHIVKHIMN